MSNSPSIDFARVREIFEQVCEQPLEQQQRLLNELCDSPALRAEVQALLVADADAGGMLDEALGDSAARLLEEQNPTLNRSIGAYTIIEPIARGGMGEVYLAERRDAAFEQRVALKLAQRNPGAAAHRRFIDEQRILARLEHPCIARMIDGGIHDDPFSGLAGLPYLVMEYVDGLSITEHCDSLELGLEERLHLFLRVCEAIGYAHRNLIVHRDLKPSNIMATAEGLPKLLDFGIAKILGDDADAGMATRTGMMTPAYAAPEQVSGQAITTSTDIYALGLLLYELLCGKRAQPLDVCTPSEIERIVCATTAPRPSLQAMHSPLQARWARRLEGDLDLIVQKALSKEPELRYKSASAFAEDVERFLEGRAIEARAPSWRYRSYMFARRHRWQVAAGALVVLLLAATALVSTLSAFRINRALEQTRLEAVKADQIATFMRELFAATDPEQNAGEAITVRQVLDRAAERIETELSADPAARALLHTEIGRIYFNLGLYEPAGENLEQAQALQRSLQAAGQVDLATTLQWLSYVRDIEGDYETAEAAARESLTLRQRLLPANDPAIGESLDRLGSVLGARGDVDQAATLISNAVDLLTESVGETDQRTLTAMHNLAWIYNEKDDFVGAERIFRKVMAISEASGDTDHPDHLITMENLALTLRRQNRLDEAETYYRDILERKLRRLGPEHQLVGDIRYNLAALLLAKGDYALAEPQFEAAVETWKKSLGEEHSSVGIGLSGLGRLLVRMDRPDDAEPRLREAIAILSRHQPEMDSRNADTKLALGLILCPGNKLEEGQSLLADVVKTRELASSRAPSIGESKMALGACHLELGQHEQGLALINAGYESVVGDPDASEEQVEQARATLAKVQSR